MVIAFCIATDGETLSYKVVRIVRFARPWTVPPVVISRNDGLGPDNLLLDTLRVCKNSMLPKLGISPVS
jgi:hypothetical protein